MKNLLGGKGANLAEMANIGLPVPPGFTITTEVCTEFYANGKKLPKQLDADIRGAVARMEKLVGAKFGDPSNPLLVSVRSGARASMPGMMDTILNLGLNDKTAAGLAAKSGNERFAFDSYRRFIAMYGDVVLGLKPENKEDHDPFDEILDHEEESQRREARLRALGRGAQGAGRRVQGRDQGAPGDRLPRRSVRAARRRHQGGLSVLAERPRQSLPPPEQHPGGVGDGRQRPGHGVRQQGRRLGHRRLLHARSRQRREHVLRRVPGERAGRGRRRRHPHAAEDRGARQGAPAGLQGAARHPQEAREALQGHAGHRVHHREQEALHASVPQREAHRVRRRAHRRRDGRREADPQGRGASSRRAGGAQPAAASGLPAVGQEGRRRRGAPAGQGPAGRPGCGHRQGRLLRRRGGGAGRQGRDQPHPLPPRDQPRGHPRHERLARLHDRLRRHDQPRGARRASDGQGLHRRLRRALVRLPRAHDDGDHRQGRGRRQGGRLDLDRRLRRRGDPGARSRRRPPRSSGCSSRRTSTPRRRPSTRPTPS